MHRVRYCTACVPLPRSCGCPYYKYGGWLVQVRRLVGATVAAADSSFILSKVSARASHVHTSWWIECIVLYSVPWFFVCTRPARVSHTHVHSHSCPSARALVHVATAACPIASNSKSHCMFCSTHAATDTVHVPSGVWPRCRKLKIRKSNRTIQSTHTQQQQFRIFSCNTGSEKHQ
jgi:hypothetical protein